MQLLKICAVAMLALSGTAQAANVYACAPNTPAGPGGTFSISFNAVSLGDTITCGDKELTVNSFNFGGNPGSLDFQWIEGANPGYADDLFSLRINFAPSIVGPESGFFDYNLKILDSSYLFDTLALDSAVAVNSGSTGATSVVQQVAGGPTLVSLDGSTVGSVPSATSSAITVRDNWNVAGRDILTNIENTYTQTLVPTHHVPLPGTLVLVGLGLFGIGAARRKQA